MRIAAILKLVCYQREILMVMVGSAPHCQRWFRWGWERRPCGPFCIHRRTGSLDGAEKRKKRSPVFLVGASFPWLLIWSLIYKLQWARPQWESRNKELCLILKPSHRNEAILTSSNSNLLKSLNWKMIWRELFLLNLRKCWNYLNLVIFGQLNWAYAENSIVWEK